MDCLIISYSEANRNRERLQFFNDATKNSSSWGRFLHLNYIRYDQDFLLPNNLLSLIEIKRQTGKLTKSENGYFDENEIALYSSWKIPLLGGLFLYQYLKNKNYQVSLIQHAQLEKNKFERELTNKPSIIALSTTLILNPIDIIELIHYCRSLSPESFIVLGGMSIWNTYISDRENTEIFDKYQADAIVLDPRGFKTLGMIVDKIKNKQDLSIIPNLLLYQNQKVKTAEKREDYCFGEDAIKWDLLENYQTGRISLIRTMIGCPFHCSFCSYPSSQKPLVKSKIDSFYQELKLLKDRGVKYLLFTDDTFNFPVNRFKEILKVLKKFDFKWYAFIRCQFLDEEITRDMKVSGCKGAYLGIESANDATLKAMNKRATKKEFEQGIKLLKANAIITLGSFVVGFPGDTKESLAETIDFIENSGLDYYNIKTFYYEHSAPIHNEREKYGLTGKGMNWSHTTMDSNQAFERTEQIIQKIQNVPYVPQHSGEIWEIAYLQERGFSDEGINRLYKNFTEMLKQELLDTEKKDEIKEELFNDLLENCY
ncbi:MAG: radical SAM protein [Spirochaetes bacterium]|nr:radical SAM protein [Spirochaetota bacterium]